MSAHVEFVDGAHDWWRTDAPPEVGAPFSAFITDGLFAGCVVAGTLDRIVGPRPPHTGLGTPMFHHAEILYLVRDYGMWHGSRPIGSSAAPIRLEKSCIVRVALGRFTLAATARASHPSPSEPSTNG